MTTDLTPTAATARTGAQVLGAGGIVTGLQLFHVTHLTPEQAVWLTGALTTAVTFVQRLVEARVGRGWLRKPTP